MSPALRAGLLAAGVVLAAGACAGLGGCSAGLGGGSVADRPLDLQGSFRARGQAGLDRLQQDETQRLCSQAAEAGSPPAPAAAERITAENAALIKWPDSLIGDWREGEKIAQSGVGRQFSDPPDAPSGGNCYACHQLAAAEVSFGTIGPSLYRYAANHAATPRAELERYTYGKIYDAEAYAACTNMPRFGARGILSDGQIRHLVGLLLDPSSPVNR